MATYPQSGVKRPKVGEGKADNVAYFQGVQKLEYNSTAPNDSLSYRHYSPGERLHSRPMEDWLKYSLSLTDFRRHGSERAEKSTPYQPWDDHTNSADNYKRCVRAFFELCHKLGVRYWTAFDSDLVPWTDSCEEQRTLWDDMAALVLDTSQRCHVKLLYLAPDLHSHTRYISGAFTSNDANTFVQAAYQIKRCLEISQRLNAECFLLWPCREGYDSIYQTDIAREIKLFTKMLKITADYKDRLNYKCQLLIMPYYTGNTCNSYGSKHDSLRWQHSRWRESEINHYMWDVTSCLYILKNYNMDRQYKVCTPPGHHLYMANVYNMLGGVFITSDVDHCDIKTMTLMMRCIVDQGTVPSGGIALRVPPRRDSGPRDLVCGYAKYVEGAARALRTACALLTDQLFSKHLQHRYSSYCSGIGSRAVNSEISMDEFEEHYKRNQAQPSAGESSKAEHLAIAFQRHLDTCEHV